MALPEPPKHGWVNVALDDFFPAFWPDKALNQAGTHLGHDTRWHEEHRGDPWIEVSVHISHHAFLFIVAFISNATQDEARANGFGEIDEELIGEAFNPNVGQVTGGLPKHFEPVFAGEKTLLFGIDT